MQDNLLLTLWFASGFGLITVLAYSYAKFRKWTVDSMPPRIASHQVNCMLCNKYVDLTELSCSISLVETDARTCFWLHDDCFKQYAGEDFQDVFQHLDRHMSIEQWDEYIGREFRL